MIDAERRDRWMQALVVAATVVCWMLIVVGAGWLISRVPRAVVVLIISVVIAFALTPAVGLLHRWMPRLVAILVTYLVLAVVVVGFVALLAANVARQVADVTANLPAIVAQLQALLPAASGLLGTFGVTDQMLSQLQSQIVSSLEAAGKSLAGGLVEAAGTIATTVIDALLILILSVYLTANGPAIGGYLRARAPFQRRRVAELTDIVDQVVGGYIRGQFALSALVGLLVGVGMALLGVRYALFLGVIAFFMEFVPVLGVLVSGALCVAVALLTGPITALLVLGYFVLVHVIEGDVVGPRIMGSAVGIHPAVAMVALLVGSEAFGIVGALFAAPVAGLLQAVAVSLLREYRHHQAELRVPQSAIGAEAET